MWASGVPAALVVACSQALRSTRKGDVVDQSEQATSQAASKSSSQNQAQPVNRWQPITDLYQQELEGNAPPEVVQPPKPVPVPVSQRDLPKSSVPMSLNVITGFYFVQAAFYIFLGSRVIAAIDSDFSHWIVGQSPNMIPFTISHRLPREFYILVAEALIVMGVFSAVVGVLWVFRWWVIRWVTMCYAGGMVVRTGIHYFAGVASGVGSELSGSQSAFVLFSCALNSIIFCYLAFYPGVKEAFEKPY
jgi:hypothetical protein